MATFHLGISMAGTVSAGTYTAGSLIEINRWLEKWRGAVKSGQPVKLRARIKAGAFNPGDEVTLTPGEIPKHEVKIKSLSGASGGGVTGALYLIGLSTGRVEEFLKETWLGFNIEKMTDLADLQNEDAPIYALLGSLPIEEVIDKIKATRFGVRNPLPDIDYIEDVVELYQTLSSFEEIPYQLVSFHNQQNMGMFKNHFDYIRFGLKKHPGVPAPDSASPFRYDLEFAPNQTLRESNSWSKLIEATPATGAFPIGFQPRSVRRFRKEYDAKLFYLKYSIEGTKVNYDKVLPHWEEAGASPDDIIDMEYFDGGAFNREPHDLARASLLRFLQKDHLPNTGKDVSASVILIDPFAVNAQRTNPGTKIKELPELLKQPPLLLGALMGQGRFHTDWVEKANDEEYYSRFLVSPKRTPMGTGKETVMLAGEPLEAFCGFFDESFRLHDYKLGHYNTHKFLMDSFCVPTNNVVVDYAKGGTNAETMTKYRALGWVFNDNAGTEFCQIIPRFEEANEINSREPEWPKIDQARWTDVHNMMLRRTKQIFLNALEKNKLVENVAWNIGLKKRVSRALDGLAEKLKEVKLMK